MDEEESEMASSQPSVVADNTGGVEVITIDEDDEAASNPAPDQGQQEAENESPAPNQGQQDKNVQNPAPNQGQQETENDIPAPIQRQQETDEESNPAPTEPDQGSDQRQLEEESANEQNNNDKTQNKNTNHKSRRKSGQRKGKRAASQQPAPNPAAGEMPAPDPAAGKRPAPNPAATRTPTPKRAAGRAPAPARAAGGKPAPNAPLDFLRIEPRKLKAIQQANIRKQNTNAPIGVQEVSTTTSHQGEGTSSAAYNTRHRAASANTPTAPSSESQRLNQSAPSVISIQAALPPASSR